jgi:hypothetical protein
LLTGSLLPTVGIDWQIKSAGCFLSFPIPFQTASKAACTTFRLYQAGSDEIVRKTFDSAVCGSKRVLEFLGIPSQ